MENKPKVLWVDDEIDSLKPHILYLESKGYNMEFVSSGNDAINLCKERSYDLVLLDEMMTGLDGLSTLKIIKDINPILPIIMITKNEEEWLMEEAIASQISNYLIKPVNPNQILIACKNILESKNLIDNKVAENFLGEFKGIESKIHSCTEISDWVDIYDELSNWSIRFEKFHNTNLVQILNELHVEANRLFVDFISDKYVEIINSNDLILSPHILDNFVKPLLQKDKDVVMIVIDCLKYDHWKQIKHSLNSFYNITTKQHLSILPTATPYSRNAIFSGKFPIEIQSEFPQQWVMMRSDEKKLNDFEEFFLQEYLNSNSLKHKSLCYTKLTTHIQGKKFINKISEYKNVNLLTMVVNFVDILGHSRSESNLLKEMIPDEVAYRRAVYDWFKNSWLFEMLIEISTWNRTVIITSDHGSIRVKKAVKVKADKNTSSGIRYKHGKNLHLSSKYALTISDLEKYKISKNAQNESYLIAKDDWFYLYPNNYNKFIKKFQNSFHHGGISMDEMIVPIGVLESKEI